MPPAPGASDGAALALWTVVRPGYLAALFLAGWSVDVLVLAHKRVDYAGALGLAKEELPAPAHLFSLALVSAVLLLGVHAAALEGPSPRGVGAVLLLYAIVAWALVGRLPPLLARSAPPARAAFSRALRRCFWPAVGKEVPFAQVLVADGLTSLARAFFDITLSSCTALTAAGLMPGDVMSIESVFGAHGSGQGMLLGEALEQCGRSSTPYVAWALPFIIRAVQCVVSARNAPDALSRYLHLLNLAKYLSALPLMLFGYYRAQAQEGRGAEDLEIFGAFAGIVNTVFSLLWDLAMDWGLLHPAHPLSGRFGLRPVLLLCEGGCFYYLCVTSDALARANWTLRWSPEAVRLGGFWLSSAQQAIEVSRRCLWSLLRVEWQCVRAGHGRPKADIAGSKPVERIQKAAAARA
mmetsp:Transcript_50431/g.156341  ORF Transcript_50431/g.156341 Transcript_50431/m.156341 type:complete len:408 (+) Transcript_50431:61-1284(+)